VEIRKQSNYIPSFVDVSIAFQTMKQVRLIFSNDISSTEVLFYRVMLEVNEGKKRTATTQKSVLQQIRKISDLHYFVHLIKWSCKVQLPLMTHKTGMNTRNVSLHKITHSLLELSPSWEAANCAATQELPSILWNSKVHYRIHWSLFWARSI
jgi:hypothetical protein